MWVYRKERQDDGSYLYTTGYWAPPSGTFGYMPGGAIKVENWSWVSDEDFTDANSARRRVNFLNGGMS